MKMKFLIYFSKIFFVLSFGSQACDCFPSENSSKIVSYSGLGTYAFTDFYNMNIRPFTGLFQPEAPRRIRPTFLLYTRENRKRAERFRWNSTASVRKSQYFNPSLKTKMIIHGYLYDGKLDKWMFDMKNRLLRSRSSEELNVIVVNWSRGSPILYGQATVNARLVGAMVAVQIEIICRTFYEESSFTSCLEQFHLIGHSLGAHVAGYAGKYLGGQLGQITGLDPAGQNFDGALTEARLWRSDARFVDVLHTDGGNLGMRQPCGHVDIFPNGGERQPGCEAVNRFFAFFSIGSLSKG